MGFDEYFKVLLQLYTWKVAMDDHMDTSWVRLDIKNQKRFANESCLLHNNALTVDCGPLRSQGLVELWQ